MINRLKAALVHRYQVLEQIGEGGMATVFLADDLKHDRKVAIKVLRPELAAVVGAERFLAEIKLTATLQHPNILPLFDSGTAGGNPARSQGSTSRVPGRPFPRFGPLAHSRAPF